MNSQVRFVMKSQGFAFIFQKSHQSRRSLYFFTLSFTPIAFALRYELPSPVLCTTALGVRVRVRVSTLHPTPWGAGLGLGLGLAFTIERPEV